MRGTATTDELILTRSGGTRVSNTPVDGVEAGDHHPSAPRLGFSFRLAGGSGHLALGQRTFFGWLHLDRLELEVPDLRLPVDLAVGAEAFQRHRTRARLADLRIEQPDLDRFVAEHAPALGDCGVEELRITSCDGHLDLSARVREAGQAAELTARVYLEAAQGRLRLACGRALVYGYLPTPAPLAAHRIMSALLGGEDSRTPENVGSAASTGRHELDRSALGPWASCLRGLGDIDLDPLGMALWHILPPAGWRLADTRGLVIAEVRIETGTLALSYRNHGRSEGDRTERHGGGETGAEAEPGARAGGAADSPESLFLFESLERLREADERLCAGDVEGAMRLYRARLAAHLDDESLLLDRLLTVGSASRELFDECGDLAARALARWPDFAPAHAALASIAVARGDALGAGARYRTLSQVAAAAGERECAARAALVAARLLRRSAPGDASALYERVLEFAPGHAEATEALVDRFAEDGRWDDLIRLLRARAAAGHDRVRCARDHVQVAHVLCTELRDPAAALAELTLAQELDPHSPVAVEVMAEVQVATGQPAAAAASLERAAALHGDRRDRRRQVRTMLRAAGQLERIGEQPRAEMLYRAVLDLVPGEPVALRGAAAAAARRNDHPGAAQLLRSLLAVTAASPMEVARDSLELARHLLAGGDPRESAAASAALERAAASGVPLVAAEAHELMADRARREQRGDEAADQLGRAIEALSSALKEDAAAPDDLRGRAAALAMTRAELLSELGQREAALVDLERAFALSAETHPLRLQAARALAALARTRGDRDAERYWLGALLLHPELPDQRADLFVRRAQLAFEAGQDLPAALLDLDRALAEPLSAERGAAILRLRADLLGALGDDVGRARSLERALEAALHPREQLELAVAAAQALLQAGEDATALERARVAVDAIERVEPGAAGEGAPAAPDELRRAARAALGEAAWRVRAWTELERAYGELVGEPDPDRCKRAYRLGMAREALGQVDAASEAYELALAEPTAAPEMRVATWRALAALHEQRGDLGRAALAYESLAGDRHAELGAAARADALYRAGDLYRKAGGREPDAERALEAALELVGDHMPALDVLERLKRDAGEHERVAIILARKIAATTRQPASQKSLLVRLAALHEERLGQPDVAREIVARALGVDPDYRPALRLAAADARRRGQVDAAVDALARLASVLPGDRESGVQTDVELAAERSAAALELAAVALVDRTRSRVHAAADAVRRAQDGGATDARLAEAQAQLAAAAAGGFGPEEAERSGGDGAADPETASVAARESSSSAPEPHAPVLARTREASGDGRARDVEALRQRAEVARRQGDLAAAADYLDQACAADPGSVGTLRERADLATERGDAQGAAQWLERLIGCLEEVERSGERPAGLSPAMGEIHLELADLLYDQIGDVARARASMRRAAERFGRGARRDATLRLLASEAAAAGDAGTAAEALEAIAPDRLTRSDRLALARCYQRLGREQRAIALLEAAQRGGHLSDEGAVLLFALHRHRKQKLDLAASLERRARGATRPVASARLREARVLYSEALGDPEGTARVDAALERLYQEQPEPGSGGDPGAADTPEARTGAGARPDDRSGSGALSGPGADNGPVDLESRLEAARRLEEAGEQEAAAAHYEAVWAAAPDDLRPLEALERIYLGRGDVDAVGEVLGRMILVTDDREPRARLWFRRARLYHDLLHREAEAYRCLKEAFANHPDSGGVAPALRSLAMARGEWALAAELIYREIGASVDPGDKAALLNELGMMFDQKLGDAEQAQRCYEHALSLDRTIPGAPKPLARLYELAGRHVDAAALYETAASHAATEVERGTLLRRAASCAERANRIDEADRLLSLAGRLAAEPAGAGDGAAIEGADPAAPVAIVAESPSARIRLLESELRDVADPDTAGELRRQIIEVASAEGDIDAVERHAAALMAQNQADLPAYLALKNQAAAHGNWKTMAALIQARAASVDSDAERADLLCELGQLHDKELADPAAAVAAYEHVLEAVPDHPIALEELAEIAYMRGDWPRARDLYGRLDPESTSLPPDVFHYRLGEIAEIMGRDTEACAAFAESVRLHAGSRPALTALSRTALRIGDLSRAISASRALLELIPLDDVRAVRAARLQLAELCGRSGDPEAAIGYYEQVLADEPKSITALSSLLALYSEAGDYRSAARVLRSLIALTPAPAQRAELLFRLGELCRRGLSDPDLAADSYLKAIDLDPDHLPTLRRLLDYYWRAGDNKNLLDVARDLDKRGALTDRVMDVDALAGTMLVAALRGAGDLAVRTADYFGPALPRAMAGALVDASARGSGPPARDLVGAALELAARAGIDPPELGSELRRCAGDDPRAAALLAAWAAARS